MVGFELSPPVLHMFGLCEVVRCGVEYTSLLGFKAWCLVLGPGCASTQGRRRWSFVGAYTEKLAGRVARVSLWFCVCVLRGFDFFCRLWQSKKCLR